MEDRSRLAGAAGSRPPRGCFFLSFYGGFQDALSADDASCLRALVREADPSQAERAFSWAKRCPDPTKDRAGAVAAVMALADEDGPDNGVIELEQLKWVVMMVLSSQADDAAYARMEAMLHAEDAVPAH